MNINFHYAAIKVLANQAGFTKKESQIIAYSSQYVDDAVMHKEMALNKNPDVPGIRYKDYEFDPICTAHKHVDYAQNIFSRRCRVLIYVCFHFIPSPKGQNDDPKSRRVVRNGDIARGLVKDALKAWKNAKPGEPKRRALVELGVALHSYADTWSHQRFSGYWDRHNNDISNLKIKNKDKWSKQKVVSKILSYAGPDIGHAETGTLPDRSNVVWKCTPPKRTPKGQNNCEEFLVAAKTILDLLSKTTQKGKKWNDIRQKLRKCFMNPCDSDSFTGKTGSNEWRRQFPKLGFDYDPESWFNAALKPVGGLLDLVGSISGLDPKDYEVLGDKKYFYFHAAAAKQREKVLKKVSEAKLAE